MIDYSKESRPLGDFTTDTAGFLKRLRKSGLPEIITVEGKAELVVQSFEAYQRLLGRMDELEALEKVHQALGRVRDGERGQSPHESLRDILKNHGASAEF
ncbi:MAG: hypothetical protein KC978_08580 [Candidatus Omnitrophica bacterium]|nr:hypothetical protein [Candidatus Omnitrophota bacterium]